MHNYCLPSMDTDHLWQPSKDPANPNDMLNQCYLYNQWDDNRLDFANIIPCLV